MSLRSIRNPGLRDFIPFGEFPDEISPAPCQRRLTHNEFVFFFPQLLPAPEQPAPNGFDVNPLGNFHTPIGNFFAKEQEFRLRTCGFCLL